MIYDPMRDELFVAEKGQGAFLNGRRIRSSSVPAISRRLCWRQDFPVANAMRIQISTFTRKSRCGPHGVRRAGSAALDLAYTACGRFDGYWEFNLNAWDTAAGALLVTEAGGSISALTAALFASTAARCLLRMAFCIRRSCTFWRDVCREGSGIHTHAGRVCRPPCQPGKWRDKISQFRPSLF